MHIQYGLRDKGRGISIPTFLTSELAELIGAIVGDGNIYIKQRKYYAKYEIRIHGHFSEDKEYHTKRLAFLFKKLFNVKNPVECIRKANNARYIGTSSKAIATFLTNEIGLTSGRKITSKQVIPLKILAANPTIKKAFLRGLADTDFCLRFKRRKDVKNPFHFEPFIVGNFGNNRKMVEDILCLIKSLEIRAYLGRTERKEGNKVYKSYSIIASGKKNLWKWMETICFNNYKHTTKYDIWDTYGFCPPYTTLAQREKILDGNISLLQNYTREMEKLI